MWSMPTVNPDVAYGATTLPSGIRSRFVDTRNGVTLHVLEAGFETEGRPCVLLLHGFPELAYSWRKVLLPLADAGFHVVAPDQRGYGRSGGTDVAFDDDLVPFTLLNHVRDALGLVFALGHHSVAAVVGHDYGSPVERIPITDPRWSFRGEWTTNSNARVSAVKGAEATISFEGTGAIVTGRFVPNGGMLEVYLDGKFHRRLDACSDEKNNRYDEAVWHAFHLKPGRHVVRVVVLGRPYPGSTGSDVVIGGFIGFAPRPVTPAPRNSP